MTIQMSEHWQATAECINTGTADPSTSRALVVFNATDHFLGGVAVFHADMSWPADTPLPPVVVRELNSEAVHSAIMEMQAGPDRKGRADWRRLTFSLRFAVRDVPPQGWRTYIAAYASVSDGDAPVILPDETPGLKVVETMRHDGDLPPIGPPPPPS